MLIRKDAVLVAVAGLLAASGYAMADGAPKTSLTLDPQVLTADAAASDGLLMMGLDKAGVAKTVKDAKLNIYGWVESGYTYNHRHNGEWEREGHPGPWVAPGPFNHEIHNNYMLNQFVLRFEKQVDPTKFEIGGMVELMYGSDAARIHATGLGYNGSDPTDDNSPDDVAAAINIHPLWQFDIPQAYVDIGVPIGNGLRIRAGKFVTLLGYETIDPRGNAFYSHSYLFNAIPFTHVGIMGAYKVNDNLAVQLGVTRGWDIATEDVNGCSVDVLGQIAYKFNDQLTGVFNFSVGPENGHKGYMFYFDEVVDYSDSGHYRVALDPIVYWQVTKELKLGVEGLYIFDGGWNAPAMEDVHAYGDIWGAAVYAAYKVNDNVTVNARVEKAHVNVATFDSEIMYLERTTNLYEVTLGATITPMPKDPYLKGLSIRPEIRYDFVDSTAGVFEPWNGDVGQKDQLTFGCDVIFRF